MLVPQKLSKRTKSVLYVLICSAHGFLYGTLYAPVQALLMSLSFEQMVTWIVAGLPFDCIHGISNLVCGFLIIPIVSILQLLEKSSVSRS